MKIKFCQHYQLEEKNNSQNCYINYFEISEKSSITQHFLIQYFLKEK